MDYRIVFHPAAQAELERLYDDIAERASPVIAWNFVAGIQDHCLGLSTFPQRGTERREIMPGLRIIGYRRAVSIACSRGRAGADPGHLLRRPEHHTGIAGGSPLKSRSGKVRGRRADSGFQSEAYGPKRVSQARPSARSDVETQPSQLTNLDPVDISTRNLKNI